MEQTRSGIIAGDGRERFMIELKFIDLFFFFYGTALFLANCIFRLHN